MGLVQPEFKLKKPAYRTLYSYILIEYIFSFAVSFLFFFFIFFVNQLLLMAEEILSKNVSLVNVARIIFYSLPSIIAFALPFSSLVAGLMSLGRLSSDNEILAFQASGISYRHLFKPFVFIGILMSLLSFVVSDYFLPLSTVKFGQLYREILYSSPELELEPYSVKYYQDTILITGDVKEHEIRDIVIIDKDENNSTRVITAGSAGLSQGRGQTGITSLTLRDVMSITPELKQTGDYEYFTSSSMVYNILLKNISLSVRNLTPREMSSIDIYNSIKEKRMKQNESVLKNRLQIETLKRELNNEYYSSNPDRDTLEAVRKEIISKEKKEFTDRTLQIYRIEFHKKLSVPLACLCFLYFAFPVALGSRKSGRSVGFGIGLFVSIFYWSMLFAGQTLGMRLNFSAFLSMWAPDIIIVITGSLFMILRFRR